MLEIPFNDGEFPVLPQQTYLFEARSKEKLSAGSYRLDFEMEFGKGKFEKSLDFTVDEQGAVRLG